MPAATPEAVRLHIWHAALQGQNPLTIAETLKMPVRTVRHLLQQFRYAGQATPPRLPHSGRRRSPAYDSLRQQILDLRRQHPLWGAERILAQLFPTANLSAR